MNWQFIFPALLLIVCLAGIWYGVKEEGDSSTLQFLEDFVMVVVIMSILLLFIVTMLV